MTARTGGDSKANVSAVARVVCRLPGFEPEKPGGEDRGDLGQPLGGGHQVRIEGVGQRWISLSRDGPEDSADQKTRNKVNWLA